MKGVIKVKEIKAPKFANVIKYLNEACNKSLLTPENVCSSTTDFNFEENYFRYKDVSIEYHDNVTYIHCSRCHYHVIRGDSNYRNIAYLMAIAMKFERCVSEWE